jgi:hypothetical protein
VVADGTPIVGGRDDEAGDGIATLLEGVLVVGGDDFPGDLLVAEFRDLLGEGVVKVVGEAL